MVEFVDGGLPFVSLVFDHQFLESAYLNRWAFHRWDLVRVFGLVHRQAIWLMPAGLVGSVECGGRNKEATGLIYCFPEGLLGLFDSFCFASFSKVFVAGFSMTYPVRFLEVDVGLINRGQFGVDGDEDGQMIAGQLGRY